jgi:hypothetical protein
VETAAGADRFLIGRLKDFAADLNGERPVRTVGPFTTDAALALVRVREGKAVRALLAGGTRLKFVHEGAAADYQAEARGTHHFPR